MLTYMRDARLAWSLFEESSVISIADEHGVIVYVNRNFSELSQYDPDEVVGKPHRFVISEFHSLASYEEMRGVIGRGEVWTGEVKNRAKNGAEYWLHLTVIPFMDDRGHLCQYVSIGTDITSRIHAEAALAEALYSDFRRTVQNLPNCIFKIAMDADGDIVFTLSEGRLAEQLGLTTEQVAGRTLQELFHEEAAGWLAHHFYKALTGEIVNLELEYAALALYITLSPIVDNGAIVEVAGSMVDISERKRAEEAIRYMAHHDILTHLPNRALFHEKLTAALQRARRRGEQLGVMFIDLDRFKNINDTLGHSIGDELLKEVAARLVGCMRQGDIVSRQGGDEFTLFLTHVTREEAGVIAQRIIDRCSLPIAIQQFEMYITPSIGISMYPDDGENIELLLKNADTAMYMAKEAGKNNYQFFTQKLDREITQRVKLENELRKALELKQLTLFFQPQFNLRTNRIIGNEALIRWVHPERGIIPAAQFIPIAEENGMIVPIGEWALQAACRQTKAWQEAGQYGLSVAVNLSLRQFMQSNLVEMITQVLEDTGLAPQYLELEITEGMALDVDYTVHLLSRIKRLGIRVSFDDFGTGYSSLSGLNRFPIDRLKIDQSFVSELNSGNRAIIKTIIDMARNMNIAVIAEGIESQEHVDFLSSQLCPEGQGYFYSAPLPAEEAERVLFAGSDGKVSS